MGLRRRFRDWQERRHFRNRRHREQRHISGQPKAPEPQHFQPEEQKRTYMKQRQLQKTFIVTALYDFVTTQPDECGFSANDLLRVVDASHTWWVAENIRTKQRGLIPSNYVTSDASLSNVCEAWYDVDRLEAERKLLVPGVQFGTYILRSCARKHFSQIRPFPTLDWSGNVRKLCLVLGPSNGNPPKVVRLTGTVSLKLCRAKYL